MGMLCRGLEMFCGMNMSLWFEGSRTILVMEGLQEVKGGGKFVVLVNQVDSLFP